MELLIQQKDFTHGNHPFSIYVHYRGENGVHPPPKGSIYGIFTSIHFSPMDPHGSQYINSWQITIFPKPDLRTFWGDFPYNSPPFGVTNPCPFLLFAVVFSPICAGWKNSSSHPQWNPGWKPNVISMG